MPDGTSESDRRLVKNEQIFRHKNTKAKNALKRYFGLDKKIGDALVEFYCECSNPACEERIKITIKEYEALHRRKDHFMVLKGHETSEVEKVVQDDDTFRIVEKFSLPA